MKPGVVDRLLFTVLLRDSSNLITFLEICRKIYITDIIFLFSPFCGLFVYLNERGENNVHCGAHNLICYYYVII